MNENQKNDHSINMTEEKNNLIDIDTRGIIPCPDCKYDFNALREYCKKKDINAEDLTLDELEKFSIKEMLSFK